MSLGKVEIFNAQHTDVDAHPLAVSSHRRAKWPDLILPPTSLTQGSHPRRARICDPVVMGVGCGVFGGHILGGTWRTPVSALGLRDAVHGSALCRGVDGDSEDTEADDI